jgi:putative ABC transport system substrate-binding protein
MRRVLLGFLFVFCLFMMWSSAISIPEATEAKGSASNLPQASFAVTSAVDSTNATSVLGGAVDQDMNVELTGNATRVDEGAPYPAGSISGVVTDEDGKPITGAQVSAWPFEMESTPVHERMQVEASRGSSTLNPSPLLGAEPLPSDIAKSQFDEALTNNGPIRFGLPHQMQKWMKPGIPSGEELPLAETLTKTDGSYVLTDLVTGSYRIQVKAAGYGSRYYGKDHDTQITSKVTVIAPNTTFAINFTLTAGGSISGSVKNGAGNPISGALVYACAYSGSGCSQVQTAADGTYVILDLASGSYYMNVRAPGYASQYYSNVYCSNSATLVSVTAPNNTPNINFIMSVGGSISGIVRNEAGNPILGASVQAIRSDCLGLANSAQTAADGTYTIPDLASGSYRVEVWASGYAFEFYNDVNCSSAATPVYVTVLNNTPNINFTLALGGSISGVVKNEAGQSISGSWVSAYKDDLACWAYAIYTASDGSYTITNLPSSNYTVWANAPGYVTECYNNAYCWDQATPIVVTAPANTPNINFSLALGGSISGVVKNEAGNPIAGASVYAYSYSGCWYGSISTGGDGSYTITGLASSTYYVQASATGYITEYYNNVYCSNDATLVSVTVPNNTPSINFSLGLGGSISGVVKNVAGNPISGAWVYASSSSGCWGGSATTGGDGGYIITGLASSTYYVYAQATGYITEYYNNVYCYNEATLVSVTVPNNTPSINFSLGLGGSISGVVKNEAGNPISGAWVYASSSSGCIYTGGRTSEDGSYTITGLATGSYYVYAIASGYLTEYYDNVYDQAEATPVSVTAPNNTANINFALGAWQSGWFVPMIATAGSEGSNTNLEFGVTSGASDGFDNGIDVPHPPPGPSATFDAYFLISDQLFPDLDNDYRAPLATATDGRVWTLKVKSQSQEITLTWDASQIPSNLYAYMDTGTETIDMKAQNSITLPAGEQSLTIRVSGQVCLDIFLKAGWNMVSVPVMPSNNSVSAVFPGVAAVYSWNPVTKSYTVPATIDSEKGYWVAVAADTTINVCGVPVTTWASDIKAGWNMIGSLIYNASIADPNDNPDGSVQPFAYWWDPASKSYDYKTTIEPTKGYWVASVQDCTLTVPESIIGITQIVTHPALDANRQGFINQMTFEGFAEGNDFVYDVRNPEGNMSLAATIAQQFVAENVKLILAIATPSAQTCVQAAEGTNIPIVFGSVTDPVAAGLIDSWDNPGGQVTGVSDMANVTTEIQIILDIVPNVKNLGIVYNAGEVNSVMQVDDLKSVAPSLGITSVVVATAATTADVMAAAQSLVGRVDAIWVPTDNTVVAAFEAVVKVCEDNQIPLFAADTATVERGAIGAPGINYYELGKECGQVAARILRGENPADIPVATVKMTELWLNPSAAQTMGVTIPQSVLDRATHIVG